MYWIDEELNLIGRYNLSPTMAYVKKMQSSIIRRNIFAIKSEIFRWIKNNISPFMFSENNGIHTINDL